MADLAIDTTGLSKRYGDRVAVDALDLQVRHGEVLALLGPNGAGKTTTVEMLEGYTTPDGGQMAVLGAAPSARRSWLDRIGIVAQTSTGLGSLTAREVVRSVARSYSTPRDVGETLDVVGLGEHADKRIGSLSGGLRRRVDVALGIIGAPELLFLDEPTTGFDPEARRAFWELIAGLARDGTTILLTTHYLEEAEHLADRVAVMANGRLVALDTPQALGGREAAVATVSWHAADGVREEQTSTPTATVRRLQEQLGAEVPGLQVRRPSLEDTYLRLIAATTPTREEF
ncbi:MULTISPECIES: ABC transporter ATP-binding protein [Allobranchiibius]|uniref:ABC-2 type transport system ATP-binding protein n=1 Tax=Allobranchiibius huperziae TaxID=1874116 RepID=A0A853DIH0_9MICO|nr:MULTISPECIES: ABC transporter ATP-binding protein [Allobranchiibius]NYJ75823.1 ABC-2 type transport system ATP-binding protein [Allobranchiibius huperziae]UIJ36048.1 ABC transporter ATP-binding protein [Allobranchiibius sp. GilTou73]